MKNNNLFVAYYRVSTEEQGNSGLGLEAQRTAVHNYINNAGVLVGEYTDVESGTSETRVGMEQAISKCKETGATLVVKEMSRISRGGYKFRQALDEAKVNFIECTSPYDPEIVKDIKFSLAKEERAKIANRTKEALSVIKKKVSKGEVHISKSGRIVYSLGKPENLTEYSRQRSIEVRRKKAIENENNRRASAFIKALYGSYSLGYIAKQLNENGFRTSRGGNFSAMQVKRLYERFKNV